MVFSTVCWRTGLLGDIDALGLVWGQSEETQAAEDNEEGGKRSYIY